MIILRQIATLSENGDGPAPGPAELSRVGFVAIPMNNVNVPPYGYQYSQPRIYAGLIKSRESILMRMQQNMLVGCSLRMDLYGDNNPRHIDGVPATDTTMAINVVHADGVDIDAIWQAHIASDHPDSAITTAAQAGLKPMGQV